MLLYHGTSGANGQSISIDGLLPRQGAGNWDNNYQCPSMENFVYLTNNDYQADFHAFRTTLKNNNNWMSLIEVDVQKTDLLYPDENYFQTKQVYDRTDAINMQKQVLKNKNLYKQSLDKLNMVAHLGKIDRRNIKHVKHISINQSNFYNLIKNIKYHAFQYFEIIFATSIHYNFSHRLHLIESSLSNDHNYIILKENNVEKFKIDIKDIEDEYKQPA